MFLRYSLHLQKSNNIESLFISLRSLKPLSIFLCPTRLTHVSHNQPSVLTFNLHLTTFSPLRSCSFIFKYSFFSHPSLSCRITFIFCFTLSLIFFFSSDLCKRCVHQQHGAVICQYHVNVFSYQRPKY